MKNAGLVVDLDALLQREYDALLGGDLVAFEELTSRKVTLMETIGALPSAEIRLFQPLRKRLLRNQRLAENAIKGMRAAITRAKDIKEVSARLRTYKKDGRDTLYTVRSGTSLSKRS